jgi:hypothetical protein
MAGLALGRFVTGLTRSKAVDQLSLAFGGER